MKLDDRQETIVANAHRRFMNAAAAKSVEEERLQEICELIAGTGWALSPTADGRMLLKTAAEIEADEKKVTATGQRRSGRKQSKSVTKKSR